MKVFTAPEIPDMIPKDSIIVFLAGGITDCPNWQKETIEYLEKFPDTERLVVFNPRGEMFDKSEIDKDDLYFQWKWENFYLKNTHIFSIYFCEGKSQTFSMYELGKFFGTKVVNSNGNFTYAKPILSTEKGFKKFDGILCRTAFEFENSDEIINKYRREGVIPEYINANATPESHAKRIYNEYCRVVGGKKKEVLDAKTCYLV